MGNLCAHCGAVGDHAKKYCPDCAITLVPWRVDADAVNRAREILGIILPVRITAVSKDNPIGEYFAPIVTRDKMRSESSKFAYHPIKIAKRLSAEAASRCIWHEMTHAAQWEHEPAFEEQYRLLEAEARRLAERMGVNFLEAYRMIPFELEAKANEEYHYTKFPLALHNRRASLPHIPDHHRIAQVINGEIVKGHSYDKIESNVRNNINRAKEILNR